VVKQGAVASLAGTTVSNNLGIGVQLINDATGSISGAAQILNNAGTGVLVTQRSALQLLPGATISGNGAKDLVCSIQGTAYGDASSIPHKQIDCKSFEQFP
jgi:hypothetical protein